MRRTISRERFSQLKAGDLILWRGYRLRTIQSGPADGDGKALMVKFSKIRPSWTNYASTVYNYNDLCRLIRPVNKRVRGLLLKSELAALEGMGFDIRKSLAREIDLENRAHRPKCSAYKRLLRLAKISGAPDKRSK